jgi:hypothetical protein
VRLFFAFCFCLCIILCVSPLHPLFKNYNLGLRMLIHTVIDKYVRGVYAITVKGRIPEDVEQELEVQGVKYRPRDQTEVD